MTPPVPPHRRRRGCAAPPIAAAALLMLLPGCGKKGPPLAPVATVAARIETLVARRVGQVVLLEIRVPDRNQDGTSPADLSRLEVYGYTGEPGSLANFLKRGMRVATIPVRRPPEEPAQPAEAKPASGRAGAAAPQAPPKPPSPDEAEQGTTIVASELLTPAVLVPVPPDVRRRPAAAPATPLVSPPLWAPAPGGIPVRVYTVVGFNHRGQRGAPSNRVTVPLIAAPAAPAATEVMYGEDRFMLSWTAPATARRQVQSPPEGGLLQAKPLVEVLPASTYNVYEVEPPTKPGTATAPHGLAARLPVPLNEKPLEVLTFEDPRITFGVEHCYTVRTVDSYGPGETVESDPSPPACVTPRDIFPPRAPTALDAVATEGAISLIWDSNTESDVAGYYVLRGVAPGTKMERLTPEPIRETTYRDTTTKSGVRYVYEVVAVDNASPPNVSPPSNRVEEVAR